MGHGDLYVRDPEFLFLDLKGARFGVVQDFGSEQVPEIDLLGCLRVEERDLRAAPHHEVFEAMLDDPPCYRRGLPQ